MARANVPGMKASLEQQLKDKARELGFDACGIAPARLDEEHARGLRAFVEEGRHGSMHWLAETLPRRSDPRALMPEAKSAIVCAMAYAPPAGDARLDPLARAGDAALANVSIYAIRRDYHDVIKGRLKHLAQWLVSRAKGQGGVHDQVQVKVFVDTAPLLERPLAELAGIGWRGKHTCVLSRELGNWLFLGVILTSMELAPDAKARNHCGSCTRCLDICPTQAFTAPGRLDARRCISYLTIEHDGPIPRQLRPLMGNRVFGCDDCLAVCPWNKFARAGREQRLWAREELIDTPIAELLKLDEAQWRKRFARTPVRRAGYDRFMANLLIAAANAQCAPHAHCAPDTQRVPNTQRVPRAHCASEEEIGEWLGERGADYPLARAMAVWALARLAHPRDFARLRARYLPGERHPWVRAEWLATQDSLTAQDNDEAGIR